MKELIGKLTPTFLHPFIKKVTENIVLHNRLSTSISDNQVYPNFCFRASLDLKIFSKFRRNPIYCKVLEHVKFDVGLKYLNEIIKIKPGFLEHIDSFRLNDKWGDPRVYEYPNIGKMSPSTLRYMKVYADILSIFGSIDGDKICEIGSGYGGQCRILNTLSAPSTYTLVDIKPALMLTQTYLDHYILKSVLKYKTMNELYIEDYDLVISNYAFSELSRSIQDEYLKKVILKSKKGYITYNDIAPSNFNCYKKEELVRIIPNARIIDEKPMTHEKNCIIIWGDKS